ncbi:uncharacterized protein LOC122045155 [Zingiber officinale]|uniref:uncharacterized protein LOC122045155 n=1 Tax=Zingiber officinale TaxID=94328 RepID=UPI001C4C76C6|nr:uncharacterized protein LOC122045155 [Zingiber officinale]
MRRCGRIRCEYPTNNIFVGNLLESLITYPYPARSFLLTSSLDLIFLTVAAAIFSPSLDWFGFDVAGRDFRFYLPLLGLVGEDDGGIDVEEGFGLRRISIRLSSTLSFSCSCMILEFGYYDMFVVTLL